MKEFEYIKNQFFLVAFYYESTFENSFDPLKMSWMVNDPMKCIKKIDVWVSTASANPNSRLCWSVVDPTQVNLDSLNYLQPKEGEKILTRLMRLEKSEYVADTYRGYFWLNRPVAEDDVLAIAYETYGGEKFGMLFEDMTPSMDLVLLKLIKAPNMKPSYPTWPLQMQNVYDLGADKIHGSEFDVKVFYTKLGVDKFIQPVGVSKSFNYLLGLDRTDGHYNPVDGGDGIVDYKNSLIFDLYYGYLIFPSLRPFDPVLSHQFKIAEILRADIYETTDRSTIYYNHKFDIQVSILDTTVDNKSQP
jgi:cell surface protein SprA